MKCTTFVGFGIFLIILNILGFFLGFIESLFAAILICLIAIALICLGVYLENLEDTIDDLKSNLKQKEEKE